MFGRVKRTISAVAAVGVIMALGGVSPALATNDLGSHPGPQTTADSDVEQGGINLTKSVDKATAVPGDTVNFTVTMANDSDTNAEEVAWSDDLSGVLNNADWIGVTEGDATLDEQQTLTWTGDIASGETSSVSYQVKVHDGISEDVTLRSIATTAASSDTPVTEVVVSANASVPAPLPAPEPAPAPAAEPPAADDPVADSSVLVSTYANKASVDPGAALTYSVIVTNATAEAKTGVSWTDDLTGVLANADFVEVLEGGAVFDGDHSLSWTGDLKAGQSSLVRYRVTAHDTALAGTKLVNNVSIDGLEVSASSETAISEIGEVRLVKSVDKAVVKQNGVLTYTVTMTNGTNANKVGAEWTDNLTDVLSNASWVGITEGDATLGDDNILTWTGDIPARESASVSYQVKVNEDTENGTLITNTAVSKLTRDKPITKTPVNDAGELRLSTVADRTRVNEGETVTFTITATNNSDVAKNGISWTENLTRVLDNSVWVGIVSGDGATFDGDHTITWAGDLAPGQSVSIAYQVKVNDEVSGGKSLRNNVTSPDSPDKSSITVPIAIGVKVPVDENGTVEISKHADKASVKPGESLIYTVVMSNNTNSPKTDIAWADNLADVLTYAKWGGVIEGNAIYDGVNGLTWKGDLAVSESSIVRYRVIVKDDAPAGAVLRNAVTSDDSGSKPETETPVEEIGDIDLAKTADKKSAKPGESIVYTVTMTNGTNADKTGVSWSDDLSGVLQFADWVDFVAASGAVFDGSHTVSWTGDIAAGQSVAVSYEVKVKDDVKAGSVIKNVATSPNTPQTPGTETPVEETGKVRLAKIADKAAVKPGEELTYTVTMTNETNADKTGVSWSDDLSDVLNHAEWAGFVEQNGAEFDGDHTVSWTGDIAAGQSVAVSYTVKVKDGVAKGTVLRNAVTSDDSTDKPDVEVPVDETGDVRLAKSVDKETVSPGEVLTYAVTITNNKNVAKEGVSWSDDLSDVLAHASWIGITGGDAVFDEATKVLSWTGDLVAGESVVVTYEVKVNDDAKKGTILRNVVTSDDSPDEPDTETEVDEKGEVKLEKETDKAAVKPGEDLTYTVTMTNNTNVDKTGVSWSDNLSDVLQFAEWAGFVEQNGAEFDNDHTVSWTGDIAAGQSVAVSYTVKVKDGVAKDTVLRNAVTSDDSIDTPGTETPVDPAGEVRLTKTADKSTVKPGEKLTYTVLITNNSNADVKGASWSDDLTNVLEYAAWNGVIEGDAEFDGRTTLKWTGDLAVGQTATVKYQVTVNEGVAKGTILKNAVVSPDSPDKPIIEVPVEENGDVRLTKVVDKGSVSEGEELTYTVTLTNSSNAAKNTSLSDDLSGILRYADWVSVETSSNENNNVAQAVFNKDALTLTWAGEVVPGETVTISYKVKLHTGIPNGTVLVNRVTSPDSTDTPETATPVNPPEAPRQPPAVPSGVDPSDPAVAPADPIGRLARTGAAVGGLVAAVVLLGGAGIALQALRNRKRGESSSN